jgi:MatE
MSARPPSSASSDIQPTDEATSYYSWIINLAKGGSSQKQSPSGSPPNERTSLLPKPIANGNGEIASEMVGEVYDIDDEEGKSKYTLVLNEFKVLLKGSIPVILAYTLQNSLQTISVLVVGRLSPEDLATAAFSYMFAMSTAWLIALGGSTALDTLASSTYTGSKNPHDLGVLLQRSFIVLGLFYVPVAVLWFFSEPIFGLLGQEPGLSRSSADFLSCLIPGGLGYIYFEAMKKYLQAQGTCYQFGDAYLKLETDNCYRDHAPWDVCASHHISTQCGLELPLCLHVQNWSLGGSHCHGDIVLAIIPPSASLRSVRPRLGLLGRVVTEVPEKHGHIFPSCRTRRYSCGD